MTNAEYYVARKWCDDEIPLRSVEQAFREFKSKPRRLEALDAAVREHEAYRRNALS